MLKPRIGITNSPLDIEDRAVETVNSVYVDAVRRAGGLPIMVPVLDPADAADMVATLDGLVLSGGGDIDPACYQAPRMPETDGVDRARDDWELALVCAAIEAGIPVLGICRGSQIINVAHGGTLMQHLPHVTEHSHRERERYAERIHDVVVQPGSRLAHAAGLLLVGVNTLHHQAVAEVGAGLRVVGWAPDGVVEAIEGVEGVEGVEGNRILGVQWHPELLPELAGHAELFDWLVAESGRPAVNGVADLIDMTRPDTLGGDLAVA